MRTKRQVEETIHSETHTPLPSPPCPEPHSPARQPGARHTQPPAVSLVQDSWFLPRLLCSANIGNQIQTEISPPLHRNFTVQISLLCPSWNTDCVFSPLPLLTTINSSSRTQEHCHVTGNRDAACAEGRPWCLVSREEPQALKSDPHLYPSFSILAVWLLESYLTSLNLSFFICEIGIIISL